MVGENATFSNKSRVSSTPVRDAASTSIKSTNRPSSTEMQELHLSQGFELTPFSQFRHFAKILASVVLPTPRVPVKRYA